MTYNGVGAWLEGSASAPAKVAASAELQAQLKLQDEAAQDCAVARHRLGALTFDRIEAQPVMTDGHVTAIAARVSNRAAHLIEDFMIAANETMAQSLQAAGYRHPTSGEAPERWARIVDAGRGLGEKLPAEPDAARSTHSFAAANLPTRCITRIFRFPY